VAADVLEQHFNPLTSGRDDLETKQLVGKKEEQQLNRLQGKLPQSQREQQRE